MLKVFRQKGVAKKVLWVVSGIIIISFGFGFGMTRDSNTDKDGSVAGKINGKALSMKDFKRYLADTRDQAILAQGPEIEKMLAYIDMNGETWTRILLLQEAERREIKVDDRELLATLAAMPTFQRDGALDKQLYSSVVTNVFRRDARDFEEGLRSQIKIMKMLRTITGDINITEDEARKEYTQRNRKVQVSYTLIDPKQFAGSVAISEADLKPYYDAHREEFLMPDSINVQYVLIPVEAKATEADRKKAEQTAQGIFTAASDEKSDFASLMKSAKLEVHTTGFFSQEEPGPVSGWPIELVARLFRGKQNAVLAPAAIQGGLVIARPIDRIKASIAEFAQAKDKVKDKLLAAKTGELAEKKAKETEIAIKNRISKGSTFTEAAQQAGAIVKQTPFFGLGEYVPEIGISEDFSSAAFRLTAKEPLSALVTTSKGPALLHYDADQPVDDKKYKEVQFDFVETLRREKTSDVISTFIRDLRAKANLVSFMDKAEKDEPAGKK